MPPRKPVEPTYQPADLSAEQIRRAIPRLQKRIDELKVLDFTTMSTRGGPEIQTVKVSIEQTLEEIFGAYSTEYRRYQPAAVLNGGPISISGGYSGRSHVDYSFRQYYDQSRQKSIALLQQAVTSLNERLEELVESAAPSAPATEANAVSLSQRVFVVHGREGEHREAVARFLQKIGLEAVVLHEQANKGRTLITKFSEVAADIGFAVVLMTPDDVGGLRGESSQKLRARQNVIFELGFFIGKLGPARVAALIGQDVEKPSDFDGVVYIPIEYDWRLPLCKELKAAGYEIDLNKAL